MAVIVLVLILCYCCRKDAPKESTLELSHKSPKLKAKSQKPNEMLSSERSRLQLTDKEKGETHGKGPKSKKLAQKSKEALSSERSKLELKDKTIGKLRPTLRKGWRRQQLTPLQMTPNKI